MKRPERVLLAHGGGGRLTRQLGEELFLPALDNPLLASLTDAAVLPEISSGRPALTTDAFVVDP
ncbi:MAG: hydrogenase expression/formation protein HypE, partial [Acidobacteriota bacterium]